MRIRKTFLTAVTSAVLAAAVLTGCSRADDTTSAAPVAVAVSADLTAADVLAANKKVHTAATVDASQTIDITLSGHTARASGSGVKVDGGTVTITAGGVYRISGTINDGQLVVTAPDATVTLILDGAHVTSSTTAAIAATEVSELIVDLADGSTNELADASSHAADADVNAALFSAGDLTITGSGALAVRGNGNDAIASKDGLVVQSGALTVQAKDDGIRGKDYVVVNGGTLAVTAGGDGLKADNEDEDAGFVAVAGGSVAVTSGGDGVDATTDLVVTGGKVTVTAGGGAATQPSDDVSTKGLKSGVISVLEGGTLTVDSSDDAVHSDGAVRLSGATVTAASGDDGIHAESNLRVDSGSLTVTASVEGVESATIAVNGGKVTLTASDDGLNAAGGSTDTSTGDAAGGQQRGGGPGGGGEQVGPYTATVTGGELVINAEGDGFDSNGTASITGGKVVVNGPTRNGNGALDVNGTFRVDGGELIAVGSAGMVVTPDAASTQGWLSATLDSAVEAGTTVTILDGDGKEVAAFTASKTMQNVVYSAATIEKGQQYSVSGTTVTAGEAPAGGGGFGRGGR
ncbi:carbohydrate-binding domain-containing protein [Actinoplanes sp. NPDC051859]|uniref:carbohydrate-binding domain-containing protein n=1 Tax=Actinoplanes sp. NPDC051859 TaxID=3363909 RepID=UPI0037A2AB8F